MAQRNLGSSITASGLGLVIAVGGIWWGFFGHRNYNFSWEKAQVPIDVGACVLFGAVLLWWAWSAKGDHKTKSAWRIGGESVGMIVGVLAALVTIFAMVDAAAFNEEQRRWHNEAVTALAHRYQD